jgi:hypothetical protein
MAYTMNEQTWLQCTEPELMLDYLRGITSVRKARLFAVACCRRIWHIFLDHKARSWIDIAERMADSLPVGNELTEALDHGWYMGFQHIDGFRKERENNIQYHSIFAAYNALEDDHAFLNGSRLTNDQLLLRVIRFRLPDIFHVADSDGPPLEDNELPADNSRPRLSEVPSHAAWAVAEWLRSRDGEEADCRNCGAERKEQILLAHDIFGNPFRPVALNTTWKRWQDGTIVRIAQAIYDNRRFQDLPILADALEEAGCTDPAILEHCRTPGEHVRGCWVVDLVLGKK